MRWPKKQFQPLDGVPMYLGEFAGWAHLPIILLLVVKYNNSCVVVKYNSCVT